MSIGNLNRFCFDCLETASSKSDTMKSATSSSATSSRDVRKVFFVFFSRFLIVESDFYIQKNFENNFLINILIYSLNLLRHHLGHEPRVWSVLIYMHINFLGCFFLLLLLVFVYIISFGNLLLRFYYVFNAHTMTARQIEKNIEKFILKSFLNCMFFYILGLANTKKR
mgnify:FL=1